MKWDNSFFKSKKFTVICIALVLVLFLGICFGLNGAKSFQQAVTDKNILEKIYYIIQILVGVAAILGAFIAVWQYVLSTRAETVNIKNKSIERAVELSGYYKDNILGKLVVLRYIFKESKVKAELDTILVKDMVKFDSHELDQVLKKDVKTKIANIMSSQAIYEITMNASEIYDLGDEFDKFRKKQLSSLGGVVATSGDTHLDEDTIKHVLSIIVNDLLNNMEYFAMHFTHGVADPTVVYQSLHQTYIEAVRLLYYNIAVNNKPGGDQFYTNVIRLYQIWNEQANAKANEVAEVGRKISTGSKAEVPT